MGTPSPGGYSLGNLFKQEPAAIVGLVQLLVAAAVAMGWWTPSPEAAAAVVAVVGAVLGVLYVRPSVSTQATVAKERSEAFAAGRNDF